MLACAAPWAWASDGDSLPTLPAGQGLVAGTLVLDFRGSAPEMQGALFVATSMTLTIRRVDDPDARDIRFTMSPYDWDTPGMARITNVDRRLLFFRALPPGTYEITERSASAINRTVDFRGGDKRPRFTVAAGVITYIGADVLKAHGHKDILGANTFDSADIVIDDDLDDDARQLYHARPDLGAFPIRNALGGELRPAPGIVAQGDAGPSRDDVSLRDVAAVKSASGISPAVFAKLEAFRPSTPPRASGTLLRIVQHRAVTTDGKPAGGNTRTLEFLADAPGYVFDSMTTNAAPLQWLEYLPFVVVLAHSTKHTEAKFGFDKDTTSTTRLSDVRLPAFDAALTPGATWMLETESDTSIHAQNVIRSIDRSNFALVKLQCSTSDRQPATTLSPGLAGTMLTIDCHKADQMEDGTTMAYLEDYGVFVLLRQAASIAPKGTRIISDYSVVGVELAGSPALPAGGAVAAVRPPVSATPAVRASTQAAVPAGAVPMTMQRAGEAMRRKDYPTAFADYTALAVGGDAKAQLMLATLYLNGQGVAPDKALSAMWAIKSAEQGFVTAQSVVGSMYLEGSGVAKDDTLALKWFLLAAAQGDADSQTRVGQAYALGQGLPKDMKLYFEWMSKAAAQGYAPAEAAIGLSYSRGTVVPRDFAAAVDWSRKAAEQGHSSGQSQLCSFYALGQGVPKDLEQAYFWCTLASAQGDADAIANRARLARVLDDAARSRVEARASAWKAK